MKELSAHGKFLLTGEYFVLDGAKALAVPLAKGQSLSVASFPEGNSMSWKSIDEQGCVWFEAHFSLPNLTLRQASDADLAAKLEQLLKNAATHRPGFFSSQRGFEITTRLQFPRMWGLGTSSTLVWLVARWMGIDAFDLQFKTFGGSGYDIACAGAASPLVYQLVKGQPQWQALSYRPPFASQLWFVYLGQKQDSRKEIANFRKQGSPPATTIEKISTLTDQWVQARELGHLQEIIREHEHLVGAFLRRTPVQTRLFPDFPGAVKSLGAWGGDFVLAISTEKEDFVRSYFQNKGFDVCLNWSQLVLH